MSNMNLFSKRTVATVLSSLVVISALSACNLTPPEVEEEETSSSISPQPHPGKDADDKEEREEGEEQEGEGEE